MITHQKLLMGKRGASSTVNLPSAPASCSTNWSYNSRRRRPRLRMKLWHAGSTVHPSARKKAVRAPFPARLHEAGGDPSPTACPCWGGELSKLGETITERLL